MLKNNLRAETLQILIALLQREYKGGSFASLVRAAVSIAVEFDKFFIDAPAESNPKSKFGEFCPSGKALYFLTSDGANFLVAEYACPQESVRAAINLNNFVSANG